MYDYPNNEDDWAKEIYKPSSITTSDETIISTKRIPGSMADGLWSQITEAHKNVYRSPTTLLEERMDKLELDNKLLRLKILGMEGKFTQEEISNIKKMFMSEDKAARTLADSIIENA
jgi:hypothetical protein